MRVMNVNDVGALPCGRDIARREFLRPERREGKGAGHRRALPARIAGAADAAHGHDLHVVAQGGGTFSKALHDALHAARARPVVLRQVEDAHIFDRRSAKLPGVANACQPVTRG